jgi:hypothetical protein
MKTNAVTTMGDDVVVLVVDHPDADGQGGLPVADADPEAGVPRNALGVVGAADGAAIERAAIAALAADGEVAVQVVGVDVAEQQRSTRASTEERAEDVVLNGYRLRNVRLTPP